MFLIAIGSLKQIFIECRVLEHQSGLSSSSDTENYESPILSFAWSPAGEPINRAKSDKTPRNANFLVGRTSTATALVSRLGHFVTQI
ncbi:hypothetical protein BJX63DRAFT_71119 [Aspergillus granulosus]|uniref:Uncharacterized protein n=1 Tax=Aspergillus granulosus TaxID=176169 RepID=A0ABR4HS63_9EURO